MTTSRSDYPSWVCYECGIKYIANGKKPFTCSTYHESVCGVCGETRDVTEPRDFHYPDFTRKE